MHHEFQSTSPVRGTTWTYPQKKCHRAISIHVPREGDDANRNSPPVYHAISIHVPREGDDCPEVSPAQRLHGISIHVPREGDDEPHTLDVPVEANFNPRPP